LLRQRINKRKKATDFVMELKLLKSVCFFKIMKQPVAAGNN
jgi:hypothetical protein